MLDCDISTNRLLVVNESGIAFLIVESGIIHNNQYYNKLHELDAKLNR
jgi:hypothetical protein